MVIEGDEMTGEGYLDCDEESLENGQSPEEACKARIWKRLQEQAYINFNDPEYQRLRKFFFGE